MPNNDGTFIKEEEKEFSRYYKFSKWFVTNRELLKKIGYGVFIAFDSILLLFVLWTFLDTYVISFAKERRAVAQMVAVGLGDLRSYTRARAADDLVADNVLILSLGEGRYDYYTTLTNPNSEWWAEFTYSFTADGEDEPERMSGFILPGEEKPVVALATEPGATPRTVTFSLEEVEWHRVDRHLVGDYAAWYEDHFAFDITDAVWTTDGGLEEPIGRVSFSVTNDSAFSYYDPVFTILLLRGNRVVGVTQTTISSLDSFATQDVSVNWFGTLPSVSQVEIIPEVNIFDLDIYKPLQGETSTDTRTRVFRRRR